MQWAIVLDVRVAVAWVGKSLHPGPIRGMSTLTFGFP